MASSEGGHVELACASSLKRTLDMYLANYALRPTSASARSLKLAAKVAAEYAGVKDAANGGAAQRGDAQQQRDDAHASAGAGAAAGGGRELASAADGAMVLHAGGAKPAAPAIAAALLAAPQAGKNLLVGRRAPPKLEQPEWHAPWKLMRVISGHLGWVRCIAFDTTNEWFATGSNDRTIKIWDLASGVLKLTLTGHISTVRAICISDRHPYLFSVGDDKMVKCWDLETNQSIRSYHGHLSGVYCASLHPTLDVLMTGGRDSVVRVWDVRTAKSIFVLTGHQNTVSSLVTQSAEPQVISGSMDATVRLWDLAAGKSRATLTNHKKAVRALALHPTEYSFASGSADNIKKWRCPDGEFMQNLTGHNTIINDLVVNEDGVLVSAGDNGTLQFWDWRTGHCFQQQMTIAQPGSLEAEHGIYTAVFDRSGSRLLTGEADKTIKVWKEDADATPQTHPVVFNPVKEPKRY
ncbi:hypothetical protein KFE25_000535 [Diacronema lutheri]|uniref:Pleiotropic regulator 1 n=1 Tax=Diacronema lutheri TaxID=2081491 RepID=A0A8J5XNX0_DIALT|nr:hypothetical protein KFE25_000535 [Diacronema lutheri]